MRIVRTILGSIAGAAAGGLGAAALLAIPNYLSKEFGFFGPESNLTWLVGVVGFVLGLVPGLVIGLVVAVLRPHPFIGALIGTFVGCLILYVLLTFQIRLDLDYDVLTIIVEYIPICAVVGLIVALISRRPVLPPPGDSLETDPGRIFPDLTD